MSATAFADISAALDARLNTMSSLPPVAWPNTGYTPIVGTLYLRPHVLPNDTTQASAGASGLDRHEGIYQVDVLAQAGRGKLEATQMADTVANHFARGTTLSYNGVNVRTGPTSRTTGDIDGDRFIINVSIPYFAQIAPR